MNQAFALGSDQSGMPQAYEEFLAPRLYVPWARKLIEAAKVAPNHKVLDVATGTGAVAWLLSPMVGMHGRVAAIDNDPGMLEVARQKHRWPNAAGVEYFEGDALALPFDDSTFQVVTCQHGLQYFKNREVALSEMHRVCQKGGRIAIAIWSSLETVQYWHALAIVFKRALPPLVAPLLSSTTLCDSAALVEMLNAAGFSRVEVQTMAMPFVFEDGVNQAVSSARGTIFGPRLYELATIKHAYEATAKPIFEKLLTDRGVVMQMTAHIATGIK